MRSSLFTFIFIFFSLHLSAQEKEEVYEFVKVMPKININLQEFFSKHVKYPDSAYENRIQGVIYIKALVTKEGNIRDAVVARGLPGGGAGLNAEALRIVKKIPDGSFTPGNNGGAPLSVYISIPVRFVISDDNDGIPVKEKKKQKFKKGRT